MFIGGRDIAMDYLCAKFGDFSRFVFFVRTDRQTDGVGVSNNNYISLIRMQN